MPKIGNFRTDPKIIIKAWKLRVIEGDTYDNIEKTIKISKRSIANWVSFLSKNPVYLPKDCQKFVKEQHNPSVSLVKPDEKLDKIDQLQEENRFLLWWNQGERNGWIDRLLTVIGK